MTDLLDRLVEAHGGTKVYVLAAIEHGTRRVRIFGATGHPVQSWVVQAARDTGDYEVAGPGLTARRRAGPACGS